MLVAPAVLSGQVGLSLQQEVEYLLVVRYQLGVLRLTRLPEWEARWRGVRPFPSRRSALGPVSVRGIG